MSTFADFNFNKNILKIFEGLGYEKPTDIQAGSFSTLMTGKDFFGIAQTGGGKTVAFVVPLVERISQIGGVAGSGRPRAIILAPTRELAQQIGECVNQFGKSMGVSHTVIYGGAPFGPQFSALRRGVDIIIATPGRLMDHVRRGNISFADTSVFILDEADRMLDMGFLPDVKEISAMLASKHQTMLFSATASKQIRELVNGLLFDYDTVEIAGTTALPDKISHKLVFLKVRDKDSLLLDILEDESMEQAVIFTRTKYQADNVCEFLAKSGLKVDAIHGDKKQNSRTRTLANFRVGKIKVLVATDVAARGIDVEAVSHVVNYNMPMEAENYVHRVGRTGRAGRSGTAYSFVDGGDLQLLADVERFIKMNIEVDVESHYACGEKQLENLPNPKVRGGGRGGNRGGFGGGNRGGRPSGGGGRGGRPSYGDRDNRGGDRRDSRSDDRNSGGGYGDKRRSNHNPDFNSDPRSRNDFDVRPSFSRNREDSSRGRDDSRRRDDSRGRDNNFRGRDDSRGGERSFDRKRRSNDGGGYNDRKPSNFGSRDSANSGRPERSERPDRSSSDRSARSSDRSAENRGGDKTFKKRVFGAAGGGSGVRKRKVY